MMYNYVVMSFSFNDTDMMYIFKETKQLQLCDENISIENVSRRNEIKASNKGS